MDEDEANSSANSSDRDDMAEEDVRDDSSSSASAASREGGDAHGSRRARGRRAPDDDEEEEEEADEEENDEGDEEGEGDEGDDGNANEDEGGASSLHQRGRPSRASQRTRAKAAATRRAASSATGGRTQQQGRGGGGGGEEPPAKRARGRPRLQREMSSGTNVSGGAGGETGSEINFGGTTGRRTTSAASASSSRYGSSGRRNGRKSQVDLEGGDGENENDDDDDDNNGEAGMEEEDDEDNGEADDDDEDQQEEEEADNDRSRRRGSTRRTTNRRTRRRDNEDEEEEENEEEEEDEDDDEGEADDDDDDEGDEEDDGEEDDEEEDDDNEGVEKEGEKRRGRGRPRSRGGRVGGTDEDGGDSEGGSRPSSAMDNRPHSTDGQQHRAHGNSAERAGRGRRRKYPLAETGGSGGGGGGKSKGKKGGKLQQEEVTAQSGAIVGQMILSQAQSQARALFKGLDMYRPIPVIRPEEAATSSATTTPPPPGSTSASSSRKRTRSPTPPPPAAAATVQKKYNIPAPPSSTPASDSYLSMVSGGFKPSASYNRFRNPDFLSASTSTVFATRAAAAAAAASASTSGTPSATNTPPPNLPTPAAPPPESSFPLEYEYTRDDAEWLSRHTKYGTIDPLAFELCINTFEFLTGMGPVINSTTGYYAVIKMLPTLPRGANDEIHGYWVSKRSRIRKPLLRRFWPVTSPEDTNPNLTFRPREKERYRLRKKRANDLESKDKLDRLRADFVRANELAEMLLRREKMKKLEAELVKEEYLDALAAVLTPSETVARPPALDQPLAPLVEVTPDTFEPVTLAHYFPVPKSVTFGGEKLGPGGGKAAMANLPHGQRPGGIASASGAAPTGAMGSVSGGALSTSKHPDKKKGQHKAGSGAMRGTSTGATRSELRGEEPEEDSGTEGREPGGLSRNAVLPTFLGEGEEEAGSLSRSEIGWPTTLAALARAGNAASSLGLFGAPAVEPFGGVGLSNLVGITLPPAPDEMDLEEGELAAEAPFLMCEEEEDMDAEEEEEEYGGGASSDRWGRRVAWDDSSTVRLTSMLTTPKWPLLTRPIFAAAPPGFLESLPSLAGRRQTSPVVSSSATTSLAPTKASTHHHHHHPRLGELLLEEYLRREQHRVRAARRERLMGRTVLAKARLARLNRWVIDVVPMSRGAAARTALAASAAAASRSKSRFFPRLPSGPRIVRYVGAREDFDSSSRAKRIKMRTNNNKQQQQQQRGATPPLALSSTPTGTESDNAHMEKETLLGKDEGRGDEDDDDDDDEDDDEDEEDDEEVSNGRGGRKGVMSFTHPALMDRVNAILREPDSESETVEYLDEAVLASASSATLGPRPRNKFTLMV